MKRAWPLVVAVATLLPGVARADGDRAEAEAILQTVEQSPDAASAAQPIAAAKKALERARGARDAGDAKHAEMLEGLARTWAETARGVAAAAHSEAESVAVQQSVEGTRAQINRERTLVEETLSRRGRAEVELRRTEEEAAARPPTPAPGDKAAKKKKAAPPPDKSDPPKKKGKKK
jgi:hypothetical protein